MMKAVRRDTVRPRVSFEVTAGRSAERGCLIGACSKPMCCASLDHLWTYQTRDGVADFLWGWLEALRWQRLPEVEKLGDTLVKHIDGIAAYCEDPVRFGVVESLNATIKAVLRSARGMRDDAMLLLKLEWATAHPIRAALRSGSLSQPPGAGTQIGEDGVFLEQVLNDSMLLSIDSV